MHRDSDSDDSFGEFLKSKQVPSGTQAPSAPSPAPAPTSAPSSVPDTSDGGREEAFESKFLLSDAAILALGVRPSEVEQYRRMHYQDSFSISSWYQSLRERTFPSVFIALTFEQGRAIHDVYTKHATRDEPSLKELEATLDRELRGRAMFVKLNTRSPKDVPVYDFDNPAVQKVVDAALDELQLSADMEERVVQNLQVAAFVKATQQCLKISRGYDAMDLLVRSQRVAEDLSKQLRFGEKLWSAQVVLREWNEEVVSQPQGEFRCFVHKNRLNAVTQYYSFVLFPEIVARRDDLKRALQEFFDTSVRDVFVTHGSYIFDVWVGGFSNPGEALRVLLIELNPFHIGAGAGLFSWKQDRQTFLHGPPEGSFELRLCAEVEKDPFEVLPVQWRRYIEQRQQKVEANRKCVVC